MRIRVNRALGRQRVRIQAKSLWRNVKPRESNFIYVSVNSNWVHPPGQPPGISSKKLRGGGRDLTFEICPGPGFDKGGDFVEIQSETFCPCIGFISDKYRVSQELLKNGEHYIVDFQFKLR